MKHALSYRASTMHSHISNPCTPSRTFAHSGASPDARCSRARGTACRRCRRARSAARTLPRPLQPALAIRLVYPAARCHAPASCSLMPRIPTPPMAEPARRPPPAPAGCLQPRFAACGACAPCAPQARSDARTPQPPRLPARWSCAVRNTPTFFGTGARYCRRSTQMTSCSSSGLACRHGVMTAPPLAPGWTPWRRSRASMSRKRSWCTSYPPSLPPCVLVDCKPAFPALFSGLDVSGLPHACGTATSARSAQVHDALYSSGAAAVLASLVAASRWRW